LGDKLKEDEMGGACGTYGSEVCVKEFGWQTCRRRPVGRPGRRWKDNFFMVLREIGFWGVDQINLGQVKV
jgi:hypothetical protein